MNSFSHVFQPEINNLVKGFSMKGRWRKNFFKNNNPLVLELGCGKGEYSLALAQRYPNKNFIGIDIKGSRMWTGAKEVQQKSINNVAFLRIRIDLIEKCFDKDEVDEIWITFPDPQLKRKKTRKRLTHPLFLRRYDKILRAGSLIHLKTDSHFLHAFTLGVIAGENHQLHDSTNDLYNCNVERDNMDIKTYYETIFLNMNKAITYLAFSLNY